jgi:hypothetical protein
MEWRVSRVEGKSEREQQIKQSERQSVGQK